MKNGKSVVCALILCVALSLAGCQSYGGGAGLGAALGAGAGALIGHQSGNALEGAAIGAVVGGLTGLIAHDIKAQKAKNRAQTAEAYEYQPAQGEILGFERAEVMPNTVRPGELFTASIQYALLGTGGGVQVTETRQLVHNGQVIADVSSQGFTRTDGTWVSDQEVRMPGNSKVGEYTLITRVNTAKSSISGRAQFSVANL
jgi:hypothetical protein